MKQLKAIDTEYRGYRFRSRLEARWAVFLDTIHCEWEYEAEGYELPGGVRYLPDFVLCRSVSPCFLEVKPQWPTGPELEKARLLRDASDCPVLFAIGVPDERVVTTGLPGFYDVGGDQICTDLATINCGTISKWGRPGYFFPVEPWPADLAAINAAKSYRFEPRSSVASFAYPAISSQ